MMIAHFIDPQYFHGYLPIAQLIYDPAETEKNLAHLFNRVKNVPVDRSAYLELVAYFTDPPSRQSLDTVRAKSVRDRAFTNLYRDLFGIYAQYISKSGLRLVSAQN